MDRLPSRWLRIIGISAVCLFALMPLVHAAETPADQTSGPAGAQVSAEKAAFEAAAKAMLPGPADVPLRGQATLKLPEGLTFIPKAQSQKLLVAMGNGQMDGVEGMIFPMNNKEGENWFMVVSYDAAGYVKDDDARDWNAEDLLSSLRSGTEAQNEERRQMGIPEMEIVGWIQKPQYSSTSHQLVWSIESRDKNAGGGSGPNGINYNTLALGREGYFSINLVTDTAAVEGLKPISNDVISRLAFNEGKRYADFNASTDKVAEYGLAALVAGVAAKKLGFFALIAAFAAKFIKVIALAAVAGAVSLRKLFKGDKTA